MADVDFITYTLVDHKGVQGSIQVFVPEGSTPAELQTFSNDFAATFDAISGTKILSASYNKALTLPGGLQAEPTANADYQKGANFGFDADDTDYRHTVRVPSILNSKLVGELVDLEDLDVATWVTVMEDGTGPVDPSDAYANDLLTVIEGRVTFRK